jgi:branched-chain amino acid transport system substrate-binding protein
MDSAERGREGQKLRRHRIWEVAREILKVAQPIILIVGGLIAGGPTVAHAVRGMFTPDPVPKIKIGVIYSGGSDENLGEESLQGIKFALWYLKHDGDHDHVANLGLMLPAGRGLPHLDGAEIEPVPVSSDGDRCKAYGEVADLDSRNVVAMIGAYESSVTLAALRMADHRKIPFVNDASSATRLTPTQKGDIRHDVPVPKSCRPDVPYANALKDAHRPSQWFFRFGPTDKQALKTGFIPYLKRKGLIGRRDLRIAVVHEDQDMFGNGAWKDTKTALKTALARYGTVQNYPYTRASAPEGDGSEDRYHCTTADHITLAGMDTKKYPGDPSDKTLHSLVGGLRNFKPDVMFVASYKSDAILLMQLMRKHGYTHPPLLAFGAGFGSKAFATSTKHAKCQLANADPTGIITRAAWSSTIEHPTRAAKPIAEEFNQWSGKDMTETSARSFTAMLALAKAIDEAARKGSITAPIQPDDVKAVRWNIRNQLASLCVRREAMIVPWGINYSALRDRRSYQNQLATVVLERRTRDDETKVVYRGRSAPRDADRC